MRKTLQAMLRCPLCEADMRIKNIYEDTPDALIHGKSTPHSFLGP